MSNSSFAQDDQGSFRTLQEGWQREIEEIFDKLRKKEKVFNHVHVLDLIKSSYKKLSSGCEKIDVFTRDASIMLGQAKVEGISSSRKEKKFGP